MPKNIVWTSVAAAVAAAGCLIAAALGSSDWTLGLGLVSITAATLASRER